MEVDVKYRYEMEDDGYSQNQVVDIEYDRCKVLWANVLRVGLIDAAKEFPKGGRATRWLNSDDSSVGSFVWCCELFDWCPDQVRSKARMNYRELRKTNIPADKGDTNGNC